MTFFYDLNKRLSAIADQPVTKQLNERDMSRAAKGNEKYGKEGMQALAKAGREGKDLDKIRDKYNKYDESVEEGLGSIVKKIGGGMKKAAGRAMDVIAPGDEALMKDLQKKVGVPQTGKPPMAMSNKVKEEYGPLEEKPMTPKQKSFAKLAPPADKITFADKIAGAKKEVDEVLGDVAADAMKKAISGHGTTKAKPKKEGWDDMIKDVERRRSEVKPGHKVAGAKGDIEKTATGIKHTRRYDDKTGETDTGDETGADGQPAKRGRGRPKGSTGKIGAKGPSGKSKLMTKEAEGSDIEAAKALLKKAGYKISKQEQELDEKAVGVAQRRAAGIAHAAQKGEIPKSKLRGASKEMSKMPKGELHKFAATKEKDLPKKKGKEEVEETSDQSPKASKAGMQFGKGIYDSMNRELEQMIAESMNISMSMNNDMHGGPSKTLTVTATDDDAMMLGKLLKMAGVGSDDGHSDYGHPAEQVDENEPDWPTNTETSDDALQYSGGLNKPKTTVAGDGQTTVPVTAVQVREEADEELDEQEQVMAPESRDEELDEELQRMREMAGIREAAKPDYIDLDKDGNKKESMKKAADDAKKDKKVEESILAMTNLWKAYKG